MAKKKTEEVKPTAYRVKLPEGMMMIALSGRTAFADDEGYIIVSPEEYEQIKPMFGW